MRTVLGGGMVVLVVLAGVLAHAVEPLVLYDDFNAAQIDAGKWVREEAGASTEPIVQIQDNRLRLFNRSYGKTDSDQGKNEGSLYYLAFANSAAVTALKATIQVNDIGAGGCPSNSQATSAFTGLGGAFFNTATPTPGSEVHDVWAIIGMVRSSDMSAHARPTLCLLRHLYCRPLHERGLQGEHVAPLQDSGACRARGDDDAPDPVGPRQPSVHLPARR